MALQQADDALTELIEYIDGVRGIQALLNSRWVGRKVRLLQDVATPTQALVKAGAIGEIVEVRLDPSAPFAILFQSKHYKFAPLVEKLEILA